jgi:hypothetical protein
MSEDIPFELCFDSVSVCHIWKGVGYSITVHIDSASSNEQQGERQSI